MSVPLSEHRVGRLPYLNVHPFHAAWRGPEPRWVEAPPRHLGALAARGALLAAPLASRDARALAASYRPLGNLGIACDGPVGSVLLFSHCPPEALHGAAIALTGESRTSRGLLRILLAGFWQVRAPRLLPREAPGGEPPMARLLIGDAALRETAERAAAWPHILDLGAAWRQWTGLPFVYARWMVRRDGPDAAARRLEEALEGSLERSSQPLAAGRSGLTAAQAAYLQKIQYRLGAAEEAGLERFHQELERHDLLGHHREESRRRAAA